MVIPYVICITLILAASIGLLFSGSYYYSNDDDHFIVVVNSKDVLCETDEKFLSVALDTSFMRCLCHQLTDENWNELEKLSRLLSPAYLRLGGTDADRTIFNIKTTGGREIFNTTSCEDFEPYKEVIITGDDWLKFNKFVHKSKLNLIIDLNVLLRKNFLWDDTNAKELLRFSEENDLPLDFQLGNEPNSFPHVFHMTLTGSQLANDFYKLKKLLHSTKSYQRSKLIGPDVTRPKKALGSSSLKFLHEFLSKGDIVDVVSWHQYYLNGRTATLEDFLNPNTFNLLFPQIKSILSIVREYFPNKPVWISETSSAYGGGAPKLSNRFVASFLWVDKLGLAARSNISAVIRQALFKDHYAMIGKTFSPNPDFWISVLYKQLVGTLVLDVNVKRDTSSNFLRLYGHCIASESPLNGSVVLYGLNLSNQTKIFVPLGIRVIFPVYSYIFRPKLNDLTSKTVLLNDHELSYKQTIVPDMLKMAEEVIFPLKLPAYSIGFWVLKENEETACKR